MRYANMAVLLLSAGILLASCGTEEIQEVPEAPEVLQRYMYREARTDLEFDKPAFALFEDGTCSFHFSMISSYAGFGTYTRNGDTLVLTMNDGNYEYRFTADGDAYIFDGQNSSKVTHFADMPDGARFEGGEVRWLSEEDTDNLQG